MLTPNQRWGLHAGAILGLCTSLLQPASGCIAPDYCILVNVVGDDYCIATDSAMMWPIGSPELATPIEENGAAVDGCKCLNATQAQ